MKGEISALVPPGTLLFTGYDEGWLRLNNQRYDSGLTIHQNRVTAPWRPAGMDEITLDDLQVIIAEPPEVLILGTGRQTRFPDAAIMEAVAAAGIGMECMDSRSAARTYNILVGEGRRVSAALLRPDARR